MGKCKNIECENDTKNNNIYCSLKCRNYFVNKYIRDYSKNGEALTKRVRYNYNNNVKYCKNDKCGKEIPYENKNNDFCNHSCAATVNNVFKKGVSHILSNEGLNNILKSNRERNGYKFGEYEHSPNLCVNCGTGLVFSKRNYKYCSNNCRKEFTHKGMTEFNLYKTETKFNFNLADYHNEFEFSLIEKYGWYAPSNSKKPNINGVSRDHMLSVKEGFKLGVDPKLLSHPANCKLMKHSDNISKNKKCSITIVELLEKIKTWDLKYVLYK